MRLFISSALAIYIKDLRIELRTRESILSILFFALLTSFIFRFAFDPNPKVMEAVGPGIVWVAFLFAGVIALSHSFVSERDQGTLQALMISPIPPEVILVGKAASIFTIIFIVELIMLPVFVILNDLPILDIWFGIIAFLTTLGFVSVGTLFSAIASHTRSRELLLPLLFLPAIIPLLIAAVASTNSIFQGSEIQDFSKWVQLLLLYDAISIVLSSILFGYVLED